MQAIDGGRAAGAQAVLPLHRGGNNVTWLVLDSDISIFANEKAVFVGHLQNITFFILKQYWHFSNYASTIDVKAYRRYIQV